MVAVVTWLRRLLAPPEKPTIAAIYGFSAEDVRVRFAWLPVRMWATDRHAVRTHYVWLRWVVEVLTVFDGWTAYGRHQKWIRR